jgi:methyltransferase
VRESAPKQGEIREAVLTTQNGELVADVGAKEFAIFDGRGQHGQRITVKVESATPLKVVPSPPPEGTYWGYEVRRAPSLARFLRSANFGLTILTSRIGELASKKWAELSSRLSSSERTLVCFGSPESGVDKMLKQDAAGVKDFQKAMYLNFFPLQKVETVRLEEAILGTLSILNIAADL